MTDQKRLGLFAGYGSFPLELADELKQQGFFVHAVAVKEETSAAIEEHVDSCDWLKVGQLNGMIKSYQAAGIDQIIMAGKVQKLHLFRNFQPDWLALKVLMRLPDRKDDTLLKAIVDCLAEAGIQVLPQTLYAGKMLAAEGHLFGPKCTQHEADMAFALQQAKGIAALDMGQTVVVCQSAVMAAEAIEGTDEAIRRGGRLARQDALVAKVAKPQQDNRFDVPAFGADTLTVMHESGCTTLLVEAGASLMLERHRLDALAKAYKISVYGMVVPID